ncbi:hypothetical protein GCM10009663_10350 [Kitasatospora arboriphila]|uniref:Uncharacterized protein n=1 Tax=Kitasatospora arboriphila TaxID=258052 RepID=A0ABP4DUQ5_9ACTN
MRWIDCGANGRGIAVTRPITRLIRKCSEAPQDAYRPVPG